jgi:pimeloyl-ACP methyl ester carboxylesterase
MSSFVRIQNRVVVVIALCASVYAQIPHAGKNIFTIRGQEQRVYLYQAAKTGHHRKIFFAPGDAGCRGFAVAIAERLGKEGYDTYCLDVLHYLESFTGKSILTTDQIASDFNQIAHWIQQKDNEPILLLGWSEGAGLGLAAAATQENKVLFNGIIAIGVPENNILAWHWKDVGAWLTKKAPHEPTFKSADFMVRISPLPVFVIGSTSTQWVTPEATRELFSLAQEPKRLAMVTAQDHKYSDNTEGFFNALRDGLGWVQQQQR